MNVFNDSLDLEILLDISQLKYVISIGSNISVQNTELGGFPNPVALPFVCISQLNLGLLLEIFGAFGKTESLAALVNEVLSKLLPCFALCVLEKCPLHLNNRTPCLLRTVTPGQENRVWGREIPL